MPQPVIKKIPYFIQVDDESPIKLLVPEGYKFSQYCDMAYNIYTSMTHSDEPLYLEPVKVTRFTKDDAVMVNFRKQSYGINAPTTVKEALDMHILTEKVVVSHHSANTDKFSIPPPGRLNYSFTTRDIPTKCSPNELIYYMLCPATTSTYMINAFLLSYTKYIKPEQLFHKVLDFFTLKTPLGLNVCEKLAYLSDFSLAMKKQCTRFLERWITCYPEDFSETMLSELGMFCKTLDIIGLDSAELQRRMTHVARPRETVKTLGELPEFAVDTFNNDLPSYAFSDDTTQSDLPAVNKMRSVCQKGPPIPVLALFGYIGDIPIEQAASECLLLHTPLQRATDDFILTSPRPLLPCTTLSNAQLPSTSLVDLDFVVLAHHIGFLFQEAYMHVHPRELPGQRQTKLAKQPNIRQEIPNLALLIERHNLISKWVGTKLLESLPTFEKRLETLIKTANKLYEWHQHEATVSVFSSITSSAVTRIAAFKAVSERPDIEPIMAKLNAFIDVSGNMAAYRKEWSEYGVKGKCTPYIGVTLRSITLTEETMAGSEGYSINFGRMCHLYNFVYYFLRHQITTQHVFEVRKEIINKLVGELENSPNDKLWDMSYKLQPHQ